MMFTSKFNLFLFIPLLTSTLYMHSMHRKQIYPHYCAPSHNSSGSDAGKLVLGVGCLAVVGYGLYKVCDWFFTPSNEQVINDARTTLYEAQQHAQDLIDFFQNSIGIPQTLPEQKQLINSINELFLYQCSHFLLERNNSIDATAKAIQNTVHYLNQSRTIVADRLKKLYKRPDFQGIISQMESLESEMNYLIMQAEFIRDYLAAHKNYFNLYEIEQKLLNTYAQEIDAMEHSACYHDSLYSFLRICVMKYANMHHASYPYIKYIEIINSNCVALERLIESGSFRYTNRLSAANLLVKKLRTIYNMLLITDAYHQELLDYERAQLERQRIEAERAKAAAVQAHAQAAQAQAAAAQQQVWAMHQHNTLQAEKNRIDQQHNAILVAQTLVNAVVQPPASQFNVFIQ